MDPDGKDEFTSAAAPAALVAPLVAPGDVIADKYRIEAIVGRGGMSVVYRATHLHLDQLVAIKVLSAAALVIPEYVARLKHEARAASRIRSEHVTRIFDVGELPGGTPVPFLVMEHLVGADLSQVLAKRGPLPVHLAVECVLQACEALAEAHALGIIHRDLKPANLFLTEGVDGSPCVKVLDFGISRMTRRPASSPLTDPGTVLGTPSYMAPEQMEASDAIDTRSDIWALGAILYELLVGRVPYAGQSLPQLFIKIMRSKTPRPSAARDDVDPGLDAIVARCLAVDPDRRYASVADLAWALAALDLRGTPSAHHRDSAARIARVYDRRSAEESGVARILSGPMIAVREPPDDPDLATSFRRRIAAAASGALLFGAAVGFVALAREPSSIAETNTHAATSAHVSAPAQAPPLAPAPPRAPEIAPAQGPVEPADPPSAFGSAEHGVPIAAVGAALPVREVALDPPDSGHPPPAAVAPTPPAQPKPRLEDIADAGPLAVVPAGALLKGSDRNDHGGPESD